MSIYNKQYGHIYVNIPKTASTSVSKLYFVGNDVSHKILSSYYREISEEEFEESLKWTIVRNPYVRILSVYQEEQKRRLQ